MSAAFQAWFLAGPTACGKTAVAHVLARRLGLEILSADAMLVYRGMDLGTAKPSAAEREGIVYHGIDLADPDEPFSTGLYLQHAAAAVEACAARGGRMLVVGGTGLYLQALRQGLDAAGTADPGRRAYWSARLREEGLESLRAELERRVPGCLARLADGRNPRRVARALERLDQGLDPVAHAEWASSAAVAAEVAMPALGCDSARLARRIEERIGRMFAEGLLEEVRGLLRRHPVWSATARAAIGYAEALAVLEGAMTEAQARERVAARTRQLAKRQRTWFRHRTPVAWIEGPSGSGDLDRVADAVERHWQRHGPLPLGGVAGAG